LSEYVLFRVLFYTFAQTSPEAETGASVVVSSCLLCGLLSSAAFCLLASPWGFEPQAIDNTGLTRVCTPGEKLGTAASEVGNGQVVGSSPVDQTRQVPVTGKQEVGTRTGITEAQQKCDLHTIWQIEKLVRIWPNLPGNIRAAVMALVSVDHEP
jgi:hypothetical protein